MKEKSNIKNIAASTRAKLESLAKMRGQSFQELLQYYFMERFLYRLSVSPYFDRFVLKGALMLEAWGVSQGRPTKDIDMLGRTDNDPITILQIIAEVCNQPCNDGVEFDSSEAKIETIAEEDMYHGMRIVIKARLEHARTTLQIDIGFGDRVYPMPTELLYPVILQDDAPKLLGYSKETFIAEKIEAMTSLGMINSRMKDIYDVWLLSRRFSFDGARLAHAVKLTFHTRQTVVNPKTDVFQKAFISDEYKQRQWVSFVKRNRFTPVPIALGQVLHEMGTFIIPVLAAIQTDEPFTAGWTPAEGWSIPQLF